MPRASRRGLTRITRAFLMLVLVAPTIAGASESVPEQVEAYFEQQLVPQLTELYAPGADGESGIRFDDTTSVGTILRLRAWTGGFISDVSEEPAVELSNEWVAPVMQGDRMVGTALVWINPGDGRAELAEFFVGAGLASAIASLPEGAVLVRHQPSESWFLVTGDRATPLVPGSTGISGPVSLTTLPPAFSPVEAERSVVAPAVLVPAGVLLVALAVIVLAVLRPKRAAAPSD